jgi:hypothetical protein
MGLGTFLREEKNEESEGISDPLIFHLSFHHARHRATVPVANFRLEFI